MPVRTPRLCLVNLQINLHINLLSVLAIFTDPIYFMPITMTLKALFAINILRPISVSPGRHNLKGA